MNTNPCIIKSEELCSTDEFPGIGYEIYNQMKKNRTKIAQYDLETKVEQSYETLLEKSIKTATSLKALKLEEDPTIAIFSTNHMDVCVPIIGSYFLGYKVNAYDCFLKESDLTLLLQKIPPSIMFIEEQFVDKIEVAMQLSKVNFKLVVFGKSDKYTMFNDFCQGNSENDSFEVVRLESGQKTAVIMFSSGTTGLPKGICLSHNALLKQAFTLVAVQNLSTTSVFLHFSSYNWITAPLILFATLLVGASRVLALESSAWTAIHECKVTHVYCPPHLTAILLNQIKPDPEKNKSVISYMSAGSRLSNDLYEELVRLFPEALVSQSYGQTEASGWISIFQLTKKEDCSLARKKPDSVGKIWPGFSCKIVDIATEEILGPNKTGEIRLNSNSLFMNGYYRSDESDAYDATGWLKTGDLGYYDEDECLYVLDRCKEMLKYRGFHIRPQKLEMILESHPAVEKAVVIGVTHQIEGDHPKGIVILKSGKGRDISPEDLRSFVDDQVEERMKLRAGVQIVESIPLTSTGKPKRRELKQMVESGLL